jgi:hypothetical protein
MWAQLVTDIQGSTLLWDVLSQGAWLCQHHSKLRRNARSLHVNKPHAACTHTGTMEAAIVTHFSVLRGACSAHYGHERNTEGDSIIVAFHTVVDATRAALASQEALLAADWPQELLAHPLCAPERVKPSPVRCHMFCNGCMASFYGSDNH